MFDCHHYRYLICKGKRAGSFRVHDYLAEVNRRFEKMGQYNDRDINDLVPLDVLTNHPEFVEYIVTSNERSVSCLPTLPITNCILNFCLIAAPFIKGGPDQPIYFAEEVASIKPQYTLTH